MNPSKGVSPAALLLAGAIISLAIIIWAPARAQEGAQIVATYRDWNVLKLDNGGDTVCFAVSEPKDKAPKNLSHGDVFFMVSTWKSGAADLQPSLQTGFPLRPRSTPRVRIGSDRFDMFPSENDAFVDADTDEGRLVNAMKRGVDMTVQATSARGNQVTYQISLLGVTDALDRIEEECR